MCSLASSSSDSHHHTNAALTCEPRCTGKKVVRLGKSLALASASRTTQFFSSINFATIRPHPAVLAAREAEEQHGDAHKTRLGDREGGSEERRDCLPADFPVPRPGVDLPNVLTQEAHAKVEAKDPSLRVKLMKEGSGMELSDCRGWSSSSSQQAHECAKTTVPFSCQYIRSQRQIKFLSSIGTKALRNQRGHPKSASSSTSTSPLRSAKGVGGVEGTAGVSATDAVVLTPIAGAAAVFQQRQNALDVSKLVRKEGQRVRLRFVLASRLSIDSSSSPSSDSSFSSSVSDSAHVMVPSPTRVPKSFGLAAFFSHSLNLPRPVRDETSLFFERPCLNTLSASQPLPLLTSCDSAPSDCKHLVAPKAAATTDDFIIPYVEGRASDSHSREPKRGTLSIPVEFSSSSSSSTSATPGSRHRDRWHHYRHSEGYAEYCASLLWTSAAATPLSLCTILTKFAPQDTLEWKELQVVVPFEGESISPSSSSSSSSSASSRRSSVTARHSDNNTLAQSSSHGLSFPFPSHFQGSRIHRFHHRGCTDLHSKQRQGASSAHDSGWIQQTEAENYQDFVVNSRFLSGNYESGKYSESSSGGARSHSSSTVSSVDVGRHHRGSLAHTSISSNRSSSSTSSRSSNSGGKGLRRHRSGDADHSTNMRSYRKMLDRRDYRDNPAFYNAFFLDTGNITGGERRKKLIVLPFYRTSIISFVDKKILKKDLNNNFFVQHPELEVHELKLTHLRKIKNELLVYALEDGSPLELSTVAHAYWYFERLVVQGMVSKDNRKLILAACVLIAIKFFETGDVRKKLQYFRNRWKRFHSISNMLGGGGKEAEEDGENIKVDWAKVEQNEFSVYVGLNFTLLPDVGSTIIATHIERLLQQINVTSQEYYSKKFVTPAYLAKYNYYSNLYY